MFLHIIKNILEAKLPIMRQCSNALSVVVACIEVQVGGMFDNYSRIHKNHSQKILIINSQQKARSGKWYEMLNISSTTSYGTAQSYIEKIFEANRNGPVLLRVASSERFCESLHLYAQNYETVHRNFALFWVASFG